MQRQCTRTAVFVAAASLAFAVALAAPVRAQVVATGPFPGPLAEDFESQSPGGYTACLPGRLFGGRADLCTPSGANLLLTTAWNVNCNMQPHGGSLFAGARQGDWMRLTFDEPVRRFGGYFGSNGGQGVVTVRFYNSAGHLLARLFADVPTGCAWGWNGWQAMGAPIAAVEIENSVHQGGLVMLDDLAAEPAAMIGTSFCSASANSTGLVAAIEATGTGSVVAQDLVLHASGMPSGATALFFYAPQRAQLPFGNGFLCVTGGARELGRLTPQQANALGAIDHVLDYAAPPNPQTTIVPGTTWSFQAWYADPAAGGAGFSTTDGLEVVFVP